MKQLPMTYSEERGFVIEGYLDAVKVIRLNGPRAMRLSDLMLHRTDLNFAKECLVAVSTTHEGHDFIQQALWRSAIVHYFKCFGDSGARFQLSPQKILKNEPPTALIVFNHFKELRNKHLVHDENSYAQSIPAAILNREGCSRKIEQVICTNATAGTLSQDNFSNMNSLVDTALAWVTLEFDSLADSLREELETKPYQELSAMASPVYKVPTADEVSVTRMSE